MSQPLNEQLRARLALPAVAAWGTRHQDGQLFSHSYQDWLPARRIEQTISSLAQAAENLSHHHGIRPVRLCWTFELARIHLGIRTDGTCLVVFLENVPGSPDQQVLNILEDFVAG